MPPDVGANWFVYLLECQNGRLYTGITTDLARRFAQHASGKGAAFTRRNPPKAMLAAQPCSGRSEASRIECAVKALRTPGAKRLRASGWTEKNLPHAKA